jgi:Lon protease-like protein
MTEIPLFPLNVVLMPGVSLPLHIFEERYKQMVNECLELQTEFGMVLSDDGGTRDVGCTAKITEVLQRLEDGRLMIMVEGSRRFRLHETLSGRPYYVGEVEYFPEEPAEDVTALAQECMELFKRIAAAASESGEAEVEEPSENLSFYIASRIDFELDTRQSILEGKTERARLEEIKGMLAEAAERMERERAVAEKARTNGYLRKDWSLGEGEG